MASRFYGNGIKSLINGGIDIDTDTIKAALTTASYTPDFGANVFFSDITNEVSGTGYSAGGVTVTTPVVTVDSGNNRTYFTCDALQWTTSTITNARYVILYKSTGTAGTSRLIALIDLGGNKSTTGDTFYVQIPANASGGALYFTY